MEKTIMLGGNGRQQETRKTKSEMDRRTDSIEAAMSLSLQELSRAVEDGHCGHHTFAGSPGVRADSMAHGTHVVRCKT